MKFKMNDHTFSILAECPSKPKLFFSKRLLLFPRCDGWKWSRGTGMMMRKKRENKWHERMTTIKMYMKKKR